MEVAERRPREVNAIERSTWTYISSEEGTCHITQAAGAAAPGTVRSRSGSEAKPRPEP